MVQLKKIISRDAIIPRLQNKGKHAILREMLETLKSSKRMLNLEQAFEDLVDREKKMSTGMEHGVAFPHAKTDAVSDLVAAVALAPEGVEFEALDGNPSCIFVMAIAPKGKSGPYIEFIAQVSSLLKEHSRRDQLVRSTSQDAIYSILTSPHGSA